MAKSKKDDPSFKPTGTKAKDFNNGGRKIAPLGLNWNEIENDTRFPIIVSR